MIQIMLLRKGHCHPKGFPTGLVVPNIDALFVKLGELTAKLHAADPENLTNVYYTVGHHAPLGGDAPVRNETSYDGQSILPFDIDYVDNARAWDYLPIVARLLGVSPASLIFVSSGNGLHIIAHLKTAIRSSKYLKETKPHYNEVIFKINTALADAGLPGKADPVIWDAPRILRLPNSVNKSDKKGTKEAKLLQYPGLVPLDLDIAKLSGLDKLAFENISPAQIKKNFPRPDLPHVMQECFFLKDFAEHPERVHEPNFMAAVGLLAAMAPGDRFDFGGQQLTAKDLASQVFDGASNSKSLEPGDFGRKWEHGARYGAPRCETVSNTSPGTCEKCPHFKKINTPLALKSKQHISSEVNGYWVFGKNGPSHPHYSDLEKLYRRENPYVTCEPDRVYAFERTHYTQAESLRIKAWLGAKVAHEESLREAHCVEFYKKVLRSNFLSVAQEKALFEQTVRGKLNCNNGIVDIIKGELLPHTSDTGFRYVLPYDYEPGQASALFLDWLAEMMQDRVELMDAVLDMMAYCLWPSYDDHVFACLVGEGANGKGTLIHVLQHLLGMQNYSAISLSQLAGNRFAPANLENKLANVSEEASGSDLSFEQVNIIKDLSAGGEMQVERKGQHPFNLKNTTKLIFSMNKPPRFHESGHAIRRRLLVVPFDHKITSPDTNIEKRLFDEVPKILSMLVGRIQDNLRFNKGKFLVSRGGATAQTAQDKVLLAGNSVVEWSKETLDTDLSLGEGKYIVVSEAYAKYAHWASTNNYRPSNSHQFGYTLTHAVLPPGAASKLVKVGGKVCRVYPYAQWKEECL